MDNCLIQNNQKDRNLFTKDFILVVIGQIISLFGNQIIRYAIPLYLLTETGSAALYGLVLAISFIPMIFMAPIGGIIADRVNKRNVMIGLDFATAVIVFVYSQIREVFGLVPLLMIILILLYAIQGAYTPAVQGAIPTLVDDENIVRANAVINSVNSISGIAGPVLGGVLLAMFGLQPILLIGAICFLVSSIMEFFIVIPYKRKKSSEGTFSIIKNDMRDSFYFIVKEKPEIGKVVLIAAGINMVFSSLLMIGYPVIITQHLGFSKDFANSLQGIAEGTMALGSLAGAILTGVLSKKIKVKHTGILFIITTLMLVPVAVCMIFKMMGIRTFSILIITSFLMMVTSTILNIQLISYVQVETPNEMISKVMSLIMCLCMCASPLGQLIYGLLFEKMRSNLGIVFILAALISFVLAYLCHIIVKEIK